MPKISYELEGDSSDLQSAVGAATSKMERLDGAQKKVEKSGGSLGASSKKLAGALGMGGVAGDAEDLIEGFGGLGAAAATTGVGLTLLAGINAALAKSVIDVMGRVDELAPKLAALSGQEIVSEASIESAGRAEEQVGNLSIIVDGFSAVLVDRYAPAIEAGTDLTVGLGLGALRAYDAFADFSTGLSGGFLSTLKDVNAEINPFYWALKNVADAGHEANAAIAMQTEALAAWETEKRRIADADDAAMEATKKLREEMEKEAEADEKLGKSMRAERAEAAAKAADKLAEAEKKAVEAADVDHWDRVADAWMQSAKNSEAYGSALEGATASNTATSTSMAQLQERIAAMNSAITETPEKVEKSGEAMKKWWDEIKDSPELFLDGLDSIAGGLGEIAQMSQDYFQGEVEQSQQRQKMLEKRLKNETGLLAELTKWDLEQEEKKEARMKKRMMASFRASQAVSIAQAIIAGATSALAMIPGIATAMGPAAAGAPAVAFGIAAAATAVQVGTIAAQKPPKFHQGLNGDEFSAVLTKGEGVANNTAMSDPGFRRELAARNAGQAPQGSQDGGRRVQQVIFNNRMVMELADWTNRVSPPPGPAGNKSHYHKG